MSLAGLAYLADGFATVLWGAYGGQGIVAALVVVMALAGEGALMVWLMVWGVMPERSPGPPTSETSSTRP